MVTKQSYVLICAVARLPLVWLPFLSFSSMAEQETERAAGEHVALPLIRRFFGNLRCYGMITLLNCWSALHHMCLPACWMPPMPLHLPWLFQLSGATITLSDHILENGAREVLLAGTDAECNTATNLMEALMKSAA